MLQPQNEIMALATNTMIHLLVCSSMALQNILSLQ
jgi:hypothetical protein